MSETSTPAECRFAALRCMVWAWRKISLDTSASGSAQAAVGLSTITNSGSRLRMRLRRPRGSARVSMAPTSAPTGSKGRGSRGLSDDLTTTADLRRFVRGARSVLGWASAVFTTFGSASSSIAGEASFVMT